MVGIKLALYLTVNGAVSSPPPASSIEGRIRIASGGQWWEAHVLLEITWTLQGGSFPFSLYTGIVTNLVAEETFSGATLPLAPNAVVNNLVFNDIFLRPEGNTLEEVTATSPPQPFPWDQYFDYYITPARLFPCSGATTITITVPDTANGVEGFGRYEIANAPTAVISTINSATISVCANGSAAGVPSTSAPRRLYGSQLVSGLWDWGDGTTTPEMLPFSSSGNPMIHEYEDAGTYLVSLTVLDDWGMTRTATQSFTPTADAGRLVSFCCDASGFIVRSRVTGTPKALVTDRHNGTEWSAPLHSTTTLRKPALSTIRGMAPIYRVVQVASSKVWNLEISDDLGSSWDTMSAPFDATYKVVTRVAWAGNSVGKVAGINASNVIICKTTRDAGKTFTQDVQSPGSGSKSLDIAYNHKESRFEIVADNALYKGTTDLTGTVAWTNL